MTKVILMGDEHISSLYGEADGDVGRVMTIRDGLAVSVVPIDSIDTVSANDKSVKAIVKDIDAEKDVTFQDILSDMKGATDFYYLKKFNTNLSFAFVNRETKELMLLFVLEKHRGRLHGFELFNWLVEERRIETLECSKWNTKALSLYSDNNFVIQSMDKEGMLRMNIENSNVIKKRRGY